ncbi:olfactory receptor 2AJ1-like [Perognathus longimembris pacificus]|uniref:olfactory receptor 2AJ1-like n=1 Tax=Perognathus longimembris pacificus TaxID=214514 RepID=UPI0020195134|nr:olfactory receptor 2AJ1-like [Perognathus longimembris pacificus]
MMGHKNYTLNFGSDFILGGLFSSSKASLAFFSCVSVIFIMSVTENTLMILLIRGDSRLHTPMYFLLSHLSFMDILHISNIVPKMITNFLSGSRTISFVGCGFQLFVSLILLGSECLLLAAMSYDRYAAICHPLRYPVIMKEAVSRLMAAGSWLVGTLNAIIHTVIVMHLPFCDSNVIDHYFCEFPALLKLSCVDTSNYERGVDVSAIVFLLIPFSMISVSYVQILHTVFQMKSSEAQKKSLSSCSFHMVVVIMYYGPFIFTYMTPRPYHTPGLDKFLALFYTILTPTLNPIIYSFRNKDVLAAVKNVLQSYIRNKK